LIALKISLRLSTGLVVSPNCYAGSHAKSVHR
jgi:hypothetical protein